MAAPEKDNGWQPEEDGSDSSSGQSDGKPLHSGNSAWVTAGIIIADVVGAGILSMANAVACFGWLLGTIVVLLLLAMNVHVSLLLWRVCMQHPEAKTYPALVHAAFATAPKVQRRAILWLMGTSQYGFIFLVLGLYILSAGKGLGMLFYETHVCLPLWAALSCVLILPFNLSSRSMGGWQCLIWLNCVTILGTVLIPLGSMAAEGVEATRPPGSRVQAVRTDMTFDSTLSGLSTIGCAFTSQLMLVEIIAEMKDPAELPKAYVQMSAPFQVTALLIVGLGGYYYVGDKVGGMIVDNIKFGRMFRVASACLVVHMLVVYMIKSTVLGAAAHAALHPKSLEENTPLGWGVWVGTTLLIMLLAWVCAQIVPFFADLLDLLGASLAPLTCFFIPIVTYLYSLFSPAVREEESGSESDSEGDSSVKAATKAAQRMPGPFEWAMIALEMLLTVWLTIFGTRAAMLRTERNWDTYGYPFACHCEGLWNTCSCSADHVGMESCRADGNSEL